MKHLIFAAQESRKHAYAPYSDYHVGAAILGADGKVYSGCNVENVSYGVTICAERNALGQMIASGCKEIRAIALSTVDGGTPCGMCLQALLEFAPKDEQVPVYCASDRGEGKTYSLSDMIPFGFRSEDVRRVEES